MVIHEAEGVVLQGAPVQSRSFCNSGGRKTEISEPRTIQVARLQIQVGRERGSTKLYILSLLAGKNDGVFFAQPVTLDSDSDSDVDTDDAQTVIFKSSPYSSPGPGNDWSREFKYHLTKLLSL